MRYYISGEFISENFKFIFYSKSYRQLLIIVKMRTKFPIRAGTYAQSFIRKKQFFSLFFLTYSQSDPRIIKIIFINSLKLI